MILTITFASAAPTGSDLRCDFNLLSSGQIRLRYTLD